MAIEDCIIPNNRKTLDYRLNMENSLLNSFKYLLNCSKRRTKIDVDKITSYLQVPKEKYK